MTQTGYAKIDGELIYYTLTGTGTPILMLHGNSQSQRVFHFYKEALLHSFRIILMDSRGHGRSRSQKPEDSWKKLSASRLADDAAQLLDQLHIKKVILFGFSDGANAALTFAYKYPNRTLLVIAANGNALQSGLRLPFRAGLSMVSLVCRAVLHWIPHSAYFSSMRKAAARRLALNQLMLKSPRLNAKRLSCITAPVLLLSGTFDLIRASHTRWMAEKIPHASLVLLAGGTHAALFRKKRRCLCIICDFLRREGYFPPSSPLPSRRRSHNFSIINFFR